jgi:prepilin-type processing-associated H-X9-DG protein
MQNTSSPGATFMHHIPQGARWEWLLVAILSLAVLSPGTAQNRSNASNAGTPATSTQDTLNLTEVQIGTLFAGKEIPFTIKAKSLDRNWRRMTIGDMDTMSSMMMGMRGMPSAPYYTRGQTVSTAGETYLIAYRLSAALEGAEMQRSMQMRGNDPDALTERKLPADVTLTLSLVNLRQAGSLTDVQAFDPARDIEKPQDRAAAANARSVANLRQVGLALMQYSQDYDEKLPPMRSANSLQQMHEPRLNPPRTATVQFLLQPYSRTVEIFRHPSSKRIYRPNPFLSRKSLAAIENPAQTVAFYEPAPAADGRRAVLYLDGHVTRVSETDWPRIRQASRIPP